LIAGYNERDGPELYWIDYLSSLNKIPFAAHGYAAFFCMSLIDRFYHKDLSVEEAKELMRKCFAELSKRMIVNLSKFVVKLVDKNGVQDIEL
jgi:20S proteasome subunit beta 4